MGMWVLTLTEAYGLMKTGRTESEEPGVVPMPELGWTPTRWPNPSTWRRIRLIGARGGAAREAARRRGSAARGRRDLGRRGQGGGAAGWGGGRVGRVAAHGN